MRVDLSKTDREIMHAIVEGEAVRFVRTSVRADHMDGRRSSDASTNQRKQTDPSIDVDGDLKLQLHVTLPLVPMAIGREEVSPTSIFRPPRYYHHHHYHHHHHIEDEGVSLPPPPTPATNVEHAW